MTKETTNNRYANIIPMKELDTKAKKLFPFTTYSHLRGNSPVRWDSDRGCWDIFDYENVHYVLKNPAIFSSQRGVGDRKESLLFMDPPKHKQMRNLVNKAFTPKVVNELAGRIADITNELLDDVANAKEMDVVSDLAGPLPVIVIAELLGVPTSDRNLFKEWSDALVKGPELNTEEAFAAVMQERKTAIEQLTLYFKKIINERRIKSRNDLISLLLAAEIDGEKLSEEELLGFYILLLVAGNETTTNLITNTVRYLTEDISVQQRLRENMDLIPSAIEEALRYYPPVQAIGRIAKEEVVIGGKTINAGSQVISWVASANRDGRKFTDASKFIIDRKPNPHLSFGFGIHFWLGAPLARLEANISLEILLKRFSKLVLKTGADLESIPSPFFLV